VRYLLLAMLLLSGCDPHDLDVPRIEDQPSMDEFTRAQAEATSEGGEEGGGE